jgi:hypothetical protein
MIKSSQIGEVWTLFSAYVDKKQLDVIAERYIELLADTGTADSKIKQAVGFDQFLDHAIDYYFEEEADEVITDYDDEEEEY